MEPSARSRPHARISPAFPTNASPGQRAGIEGRVAFALAAYALAVSLVVLIERIGVPQGLIAALGPAVTLGGLAIVGLATASMRRTNFYEAARAVPALYGGLSLAALTAALAAPFVGLGAGLSGGGAIYAGLAGGMLLAALITGPAVRASGSASLATLFADRFPGSLPRALIALALAGTGLLAALGALQGAVHTLVSTTGLGRSSALLVLSAALAAVGVPGGMAGIIWASAAAAAIALASIAIAVGLSVYPQFDLPLPVLGDGEAWGKAMERMAQWHASAPSQPESPIIVFAALVLGIAGLAPLLLPAVGVPQIRAARRAGIAAILATTGLAALAAAAAALTALALDPALVGQAPDRLPAWAYAESGKGMLTICGEAAATPAAARAACAAAADFTGTLRAQDVGVAGAELLTGLAQVRGFGMALSEMVAAALVGLQLMLAAAGLFVVATATGLGRQALRMGRRLPASLELALARGLYLAALCAIAGLERRMAPHPEAWLGLAIALSAGTVTPLLVLSRWPRVGSVGASAALAVGLGIIVASAGLNGAWPQAPFLAGEALYAAAAAFIAGLLATALSAAPTLRPPDLPGT